MTNDDGTDGSYGEAQYIECLCGKLIPFVANSKLMGKAIEAHALEHSKNADAKDVDKIEEYLIRQVIKKITTDHQL